MKKDSQSQGNLSVLGGTGGVIPGVQRYCHTAMAATFEIYIAHPEEDYAQKAAGAAFDELDRLERQLSRFVENSDISRLNAIKPNEPLLLGPEAFESLRLAQIVYEETDGAFDITIGSLLACWMNKDKSIRNPSPDELNVARGKTGMRLLELDESDFTIQVAVEDVRVDLGGIGKGYALDRMAALLREWSIESALIHGGGSTVLALDGPPGAEGWLVTLSNPSEKNEVLVRLSLRNQALSGSGLRQARHIIDPRSGRAVAGRIASWALVSGPSCFDADVEPAFPLVAAAGEFPAAIADSLSTAFIVMSIEEIERYCRDHPNISAMIALEGESLEDKAEAFARFGSWDNRQSSL